METSFIILLFIVVFLIILSFFTLFHLMIVMRTKISLKELNNWFIILVGLPMLGSILYLNFVYRFNKKSDNQ